MANYLGPCTLTTLVRWLLLSAWVTCCMFGRSTCLKMYSIKHTALKFWCQKCNCRQLFQPHQCSAAKVGHTSTSTVDLRQSYLIPGWQKSMQHEVRVKPSLVPKLNQACVGETTRMYTVWIHDYELAPRTAPHLQFGWPAGQTMCWCHDWWVNKKLSSLEHKRVKESYSSSYTFHF